MLTFKQWRTNQTAHPAIKESKSVKLPENSSAKQDGAAAKTQMTKESKQQSKVTLKQLRERINEAKRNIHQDDQTAMPAKCHVCGN